MIRFPVQSHHWIVLSFFFKCGTNRHKLLITLVYMIPCKSVENPIFIPFLWLVSGRSQGEDAPLHRHAPFS